MITKYNVTEQQQTLLTSLDLGLVPAGYRRFDLTAEQQKDVIDALVAMKPEATAGQKRIISTLLKRLGVTSGFTKRIRSGYFIENNYVDRLNFIAEMTNVQEQALTFSVTADGNLDCNDWLLANGRFINTASRASDLKMIPADVLRILNDNISLHERRVGVTVESLQAVAPAPAPKTQGVNLMDLIEQTPATSGPNLMDLIEQADAGEQGELFPEPKPVLAPLPVITAPMLWDEGPSQADLDEIEALDFLDASTDAPEEDTTEEEPEEELETVGLDEWLAAEEGDDDDANDFDAMDDDHTFADTLTDAFSVRQARRCGFLISAIEQLEWNLIDDEQLLDADNEVIGVYDADAYTISFADMSAAEALGEEIKVCADETYMDKQYAGDLDDDEERDWSRVNEEADIMIQG